MLSSAKRLGVLALFGAAVALVTTAHGQINTSGSTINRTNTVTQGSGSNIRIGPGVLLNDNRFNPISSNPYSPSTGSYATCYGYCPGSYSGCNGYGGGYGYGGYSGGYCQDPLNGFLTGAASVISAQSQFVVSKRQAQLINEQSRQAAVDTQHKIYEEWKYERNDQPTLEQIRRDAWEQAYKRAVFHPPLNDVWSADALNRILDHATRLQGRGASTSGVPIDDDMLKRINFSTGVSGNIGALKNKGKLDWPAILGRKEFAAERDRFNQLAADAVRQGGENNKVDAGVLEDMERDLNIMDDKLTGRIRDLAPDDYLEAKRYLQDLRSAMRILKRPDVAKHLNNEYAVSAKTVNELVKNMSNAGVRFAKARDGEEWAYNALYRALLSYDLGLAEKAGDNR
jgi:hypothetical protein